MSKSNNGSNGREKKLAVVTEKNANQLEREAAKIRMDANYIKWMRTAANDRQILELRDELRIHRENVQAQQKLAQEADLLLLWVNYLVMMNLNLRVGSAEEARELRQNSKKAREEQPDDGGVDAICILSMEDLQAVMRGRKADVSTSDDGSQWIIQISKPREE